MDQNTLVREALLSYADNEPPIPYSSDELMRAGRRARLRSWVAWGAGGGGTVAALAGVVALVLSGSTPAQGPQVGGQTWTTLDPAPFCAAAAEPFTPGQPRSITDGDGFKIVIPTEPTAHAAARLSCYLMTAVPRRLPGVTFGLDPVGPATSYPLEAKSTHVYDVNQPQDVTPPMFGASASVTDTAGTGVISFAVISSYETVEHATKTCVEDPRCEIRSGPHGGLVTILDVPDRPGLETVSISVYSGQTTVWVTATNSTWTGWKTPDEPGGPPEQIRTITRPDLPISIDKLIEIAAAPELTLFP